jgi:hypothetical protein
MIINNIEELNDLIREMEKRTGLFIGYSDLGRLLSFLDGFIYSKDINNIPYTQKEQFYIDNFYKWLVNYYAYPPDISAGVESIIKFHAGLSPEEEAKLFFCLYKQWHKEEFGEDAW